jgi:hypothetical protein
VSYNSNNFDFFYPNSQEPVKKPLKKYFGNFNNNSDPIWKDENRFVRSAATSTTLLPDNKLAPPVLAQNDPKRFIAVYNDEYNNRLANAWEFDYTIRGAINRLVFFILGKTDSIKTTLYPNIREQIQSEFQAKNELAKVRILRSADEIADQLMGSQFSEQEQLDLQEFIDNTDRVTRLYPSLQKPLKSSYIFGRSALWIQKTPDGILDLKMPAGSPLALKPLNSRYLGQVKINTVNWNISEVEYNDPQAKMTKDGDPNKEFKDDGGAAQQNSSGDSTTWLPIEDLIYFTRDDDNIVGDSLHYGLSTVQTILALSEENRRINQRVMPEIHESMWGGSALWTFPGWSSADITTFLATIKPGKNITVNSPDVSVENIALQYDEANLLSVRDSNEKKILGAFGVPDFLLNIKAASAQKTMGDELIAFQESIIESERAWIRDILDEYWYRRLLNTYFPEDQYIHIKLKVVTEFKNISFESFFEKALALETLVSNKLMTQKEARELLSLPLIDEVLTQLNPTTVPTTVDPTTPATEQPSTTTTPLDQTQIRPPQTQLQNKANENTQRKRLTKPF